jgi:hypothetical protein
MDKGGGELFAVRALNPDDKFAKGWSGSVVRDADGPVGIVFDVDPDHNEANAVRIDAIRRIMKGTSPVPASEISENPTNVMSAAIVSIAGATQEPTHGADQILRPDGAGWRVTPDHQAISFSITYENPTQLHHLQLAFENAGGAAVTGLEISTSANETGDEWVSVGYCPLGTSNGVIACSIAPSTVRRLQVVAGTKSDVPIVIRSFWAE